MANIPPLELLRATHSFPGLYTFKLIGNGGRNFERTVAETIRDSLALIEVPTSSLRETPGKRHVAVTVEVPVESAEQVLAAYERLRNLEGLVVML